jgi:hypothetical protein
MRTLPRWGAVAVSKAHAGPSHGPVSNWVQLVPPNTGPRRPTCSQATGGPSAEALAGVLPAALHQQTQHAPKPSMPPPGGLPPGGRYQRQVRLSRGGGVWNPVDLPQGYHTAPRGQSYTTLSPVASRAAPGPPRSDSVTVDGMPHGSHRARSVSVVGDLAATLDLPFAQARWGQGADLGRHRQLGPAAWWLG